MHQYIESLRRKPDHHKQKVAMLGAGAITGLIFIGWLSVILPSNTSQIVASSKESRVTTEDSNTPIDSIKKNTAQVFTSIKELLSESKNQVNLEQSYTKMKTQVEEGDIKIVPEGSSN